MYNPSIQVTWGGWNNSKYFVKGCYSILMAHVISSPDLDVFELYKSCRMLEGCSFILVLSLIIWYQRSLLLNILTTTLTITVSSFQRLNAASRLTPSWELIIPIEILTPVSCVSILTSSLFLRSGCWHFSVILAFPSIHIFLNSWTEYLLDYLGACRRSFIMNELQHYCLCKFLDSFLYIISRIFWHFNFI